MSCEVTCRSIPLRLVLPSPTVVPAGHLATSSVAVWLPYRPAVPRCRNGVVLDTDSLAGIESRIDSARPAGSS